VKAGETIDFTMFVSFRTANANTTFKLKQNNVEVASKTADISTG